MLRIKDSVDLEELEKFRFKRRHRNCYEYIREIHGETAYRVYTTPNHSYLQIEILKPIKIAKSLQDLLYSLIKAGLVEKIEEEKDYEENK